MPRLGSRSLDIDTVERLAGECLLDRRGANGAPSDAAERNAAFAHDAAVRSNDGGNRDDRRRIERFARRFVKPERAGGR